MILEHVSGGIPLRAGSVGGHGRSSAAVSEWCRTVRSAVSARYIRTTFCRPGSETMPNALWPGRCRCRDPRRDSLLRPRVCCRSLTPRAPVCCGRTPKWLPHGGRRVKGYLGSRGLQAQRPPPGVRGGGRPRDRFSVRLAERLWRSYWGAADLVKMSRPPGLPTAHLPCMSAIRGGVYAQATPRQHRTHNRLRGRQGHQVIGGIRRGVWRHVCR